MKYPLLVTVIAILFCASVIAQAADPTLESLQAELLVDENRIQNDEDASNKIYSQLNTITTNLTNLTTAYNLLRAQYATQMYNEDQAIKALTIRVAALEAKNPH